ncbi:alpha/beta fold hydrolase [Thiohalorhabdus sp.]|uniref:alpha/beta fold hydrolase n=1 Tax=Thiohalorhabdus sp. TaxID=3094134 RepID=UPI002FC2DD18
MVTPGECAPLPSEVAPVEADQRLRLADGRELAYNFYGDPEGEPVIYFHGFPGSWLEAGMSQPEAARLGLCLVAPDRPGIGLSTPQAGRPLCDWPGDVRELADALRWDQFRVLGFSGGAPYALACAAFLPERISRVAVVAGMAPLANPNGTRGMGMLGRLLLVLARYWPFAGRLLLRGAAAAAMRDPQELPPGFAAGLPPADRAVLRRAWLSRLLRASLGESFRQGFAGNQQDLALLARPWGLRLTDIATSVSLCHGEADAIVPATMGRYLASRLPRCYATFLPGEGHFSLAINRAEIILEALKEERSQ